MAQKGRLIADHLPSTPPPPNSVTLPGPFTRDDFALVRDRTLAKRRTVVANAVTITSATNSLTDLEKIRVRVENGLAQFADEDDLALVAVIARDGSSKSVGVVKDLGLRVGAYASSFAHDSHNLLVVGRTADEMCLAANAVGEMRERPFLMLSLLALCLTALQIQRQGCGGCGSTARVAYVGERASSIRIQANFYIKAPTKGYRGDSSWARGLTWALYGFGTAYTFTRDARFLQTAEACANFYIERTPSHSIPPNDWDEPNAAVPYESSAAAIAASGMLNVAQLTGDVAQARLYRDYALKILNTLTEPEFIANETPGWKGILKHACYHQRKRLGGNESVMWGDYFFLEALRKAKLICQIDKNML